MLRRILILFYIILLYVIYLCYALYYENDSAASILIFTKGYFLCLTLFILLFFFLLYLAYLFGTWTAEEENSKTYSYRDFISEISEPLLEWYLCICLSLMYISRLGMDTIMRFGTCI